MKKNVGVIGSTGRMGQLLMEKLRDHPFFKSGPGFSRFHQSSETLEHLFAENDYVVDFSTPLILPTILQAALIKPKPLIICTTGWSMEENHASFQELSTKAPLVIASNTSFGAFLQRKIAQDLSRYLSNEYDIDVMEKHHRHKKDAPSGTSISLIHTIQQAKKSKDKKDYTLFTHPEEGARPHDTIGVSVQRSGNLPGDHEVSFTSAHEMISVRHVVFDRGLFAMGALKIVEWLHKNLPNPGFYTMEDVLEKSS